jgi:hypothetical protein
LPFRDIRRTVFSEILKAPTTGDGKVAITS